MCECVHLCVCVCACVCREERVDVREEGVMAQIKGAGGDKSQFKVYSLHPIGKGLAHEAATIKVNKHV